MLKKNQKFFLPPQKNIAPLSLFGFFCGPFLLLLLLLFIYCWLCNRFAFFSLFLPLLSLWPLVFCFRFHFIFCSLSLCVSLFFSGLWQSAEGFHAPAADSSFLQIKKKKYREKKNCSKKIAQFFG